MTSAVMNYTWKPLSGFWASFWNFCEVAGYSRAAAHLASMGLYEEAKNCMEQIQRIKSK